MGIPAGGFSVATSMMCLGEVAKANELSRALRAAAKCSSTLVIELRSESCHPSSHGEQRRGRERDRDGDRDGEGHHQAQGGREGA